MGDLAVAVVVGRLTRDAELKYTNSGQAICHFSIATNARVKKGDQWIDESSYWDVDLWGKRGESVNQYLTKGKLIAVEGDMRQDRWEQDGQQRMKVRINANDVQLLGSGENRGETRFEAKGSRDRPFTKDSSDESRNQGGSDIHGGSSPERAIPRNPSSTPSRETDRQSEPSSGNDGFTDDIPF